MRHTVERLHEKRQIELAKSILESRGYKVEKKESIKEAIDFEVVFKDSDATFDNFIRASKGFDGDYKMSSPISIGNITYTDTNSMIEVIFDQAGRIYSFKEKEDVVDAIDKVLSGWESDNYEYEDNKEYVDLYASVLAKLDYVLGTNFSDDYWLEYVGESKKVNEEIDDDDEDDYDDEDEYSSEGYWAISISAESNAPNTKYYDGSRNKVGREILSKVRKDDSNIQVDALGYDDITFIMYGDRQSVVELGEDLAKVVEPFPNERGVTVSISGPYEDEDVMDAFDDEEIIQIYQDGRVVARSTM